MMQFSFSIYMILSQSEHALKLCLVKLVRFASLFFLILYDVETLDWGWDSCNVSFITVQDL